MLYDQIDSNKRRSTWLVILFVVFVLAVGWLLSYTTDFGYGWLVVAFFISIAMSISGYFYGDRMALASSGAQQIAKEDNPYVYRMVENLCIATGLPIPKVHIIPDNSINAFATGRDPEHASVAVTQGAIDKLENEELEGVIAHELAHIQNYDIRLMTLVIVLVGTLALLSDIFIRSRLFGGSNDNRNQGGLLAIVGVALIILSPIIAKLIQLAVSRKREFLADASGALMTRYPEGLARALEKIGQQSQPLRRASQATAHLYISNPFGKTSLAKLFSTHPPIEERVAALRSGA